jgi:hypothetical protein
VKALSKAKIHLTIRFHRSWSIVRRTMVGTCEISRGNKLANLPEGTAPILIRTTFLNYKKILRAAARKFQGINLCAVNSLIRRGLPEQGSSFFKNWVER